jgi:CMD domain protein
MTIPSDVINKLAGIEEQSDLGMLRANRTETFTFAQGSFLALLEPDDPAGVSLLEREAIALRVATLERSQALIDFHTERLQALAADEEFITSIVDFPEGFDGEDRLRAILKHVDLLTCSSRNGSPGAIANLRAAGLTDQDIVTVSQLIAYLSYEIRLIATLRALQEVA